jgi:predicted DNA-binding protein (MmcQ/YjbR family)
MGMRYEWLDGELLSMPGVEKDFKVEWQWVRYMVGGKMFAATLTDGEGRAVVSLKLDPLEGEFLRGQYPDIAPGYYMNKRHWNSVRLDGAVPDDLLRELARKSYRLVLGGLPKKRRESIGV